MRLTLRTMLAYLDDILEPDDAADIGRKIEESEFATSLMHRTRDCMRRLRLGAPPLVGRGIGLDPNTVAEYLDNTLSAERVPDFEKVCLESDVHLAEVASCHQILTLVLGEPADIDPAGRDRMYRIIARTDAAAAPTIPAPPPVKPPALKTPSKRQKPEIPDYLRDSSRSRFWAVAATILVALLLTGGLLAMFGPPEMRERITGFLGLGPADVNELAEADAAPPVDPNPAPPAERRPADTADGQPVAEAADRQTPEPTVADDAAADTDQGEPAATTATDAAAVEEQVDATSDTSPVPSDEDTGVSFPIQPATTSADDSDAPAAPEPGETALPADNASDEETDPDAAMDAADLETSGTLPDEMPDDPLSFTQPPAKSAATARGADAGDVADVGPKPTDLADSDVVGPDLTVDQAVKPSPETAAKGLGRFLSDTDVLLHYDQAADGWNRLRPKAVLAAGDKLLSLPAFRPRLALTSGIDVQAVAPSSLELLPLDAQGVPGVAIEFGRLIMLTTGKAGNHIRIQFGEREGIVTFSDPEATLAIEVRRMPPAGENPEDALAPLAVDLYATSGQIHWEEGGTSNALAAPMRKVLTEQPAAQLAGDEFPDWVSTDVTSPLDRRAAPTVTQALVPDRPISLSLKELTDSRQVEVRSLAIRSLGYIGYFEPLVAALNDEGQRMVWPAHIEVLREAIARSPETAADVRAALEKARGNDALPLYRMLWGYTENNLKQGEAARLVEFLNHESLDYRVLSFWNLHTITGMGLNYRPEYPPARRRAMIRDWSERLKEGKIVPGSARAASRPAPRSATPAGDPIPPLPR